MFIFIYPITYDFRYRKNGIPRLRYHWFTEIRLSDNKVKFETKEGILLLSLKGQVSPLEILEWTLDTIS